MSSEALRTGGVRENEDGTVGVEKLTAGVREKEDGMSGVEMLATGVLAGVE